MKLLTKAIEKQLEKYPLYSDQRDLFLTSDVILTIVDPSEDTIKNYKKAL